MFNKFLKKIRHSIDKILQGTHDHYTWFLPERIGVISSFLLEIFFSGIRLDDDQKSVIRRLPKNAIIIYVTKHTSDFERLFYYSRYRIDGLPFPEIGFFHRIFLWQPVSRLFKICLAHLDHFCRHLAVPDPFKSGYIKNELLDRRTAVMSLVKPHEFYRRFVKSKTDPLEYLIRMQKSVDRPIYLVPQLMFFGTTPSASGQALKDPLIDFKQKPGAVRRLRALISRPGKIFVEVSEPILLKDFIEAPDNSHQSDGNLALKLRHQLLDQINRHHRSTTGPILKSIEEIKQHILTNNRLQSFMKTHAERRNIPVQKVHGDALKYVDEIAAAPHPFFIKLGMHAAKWILGHMFEEISYNKNGLSKMKQASRKGPLILIPCHKSHVDYEVLTETTPQDATLPKKGKEITVKDAGEGVKPATEDKVEPKRKKAPVKKEAEEKETPAKKTAKPSTVKKLKPAKKTKKPKKETPAKIIKLPIPTPEIPLEEPEEPLKKPAAKGKKSSAVDTVDMTLEPMEEDLSPAEKKKLSKKKLGEPLKDKKFFKKKISFRSKEVIEGEDLYAGDKSRIKKSRKTAKTKASKGQKPQITIPKAIKRRIKIDDTIILSDLAKRMGIKANEMLKQLMTLGVMATVNQTIDFDTATLVASEFNYEVERASFEEESVLHIQTDDPGKLTYRPPVVTIMGHVDHGKTSLLDVIRKTKITEFEAGGITQHIGAYYVKTDNGQIVFLDTPGHEAFTAMRARGAKVTDIVVLVVAADDGVMPQTIEAINHSNAAGVPIIVAVNKIDKDNADVERVQRELADQGLVSEEWGGDTIFVNVSAKQNIGINDLLEMIILQSEVLELKANADKLARGHVIEATLDSGRGPVATVLIKEGTLRSGESVVCGVHYGKVRAMLNDRGVQVETAEPSMPVEVLGLSGVPMAGDEMVAIADDKSARQVSEHRTQKQRALELAKSSRLSLEGLFEQMQEGDVKELNLIIKADVHGSIEALKDSLTKLSTDEVKIKVVHSATGTITESDIALAAVSNAIILGFNVRPGVKVHDFASEENVDMRFYDVIYDAIKDIKDAILGMMASTFEERILGRAEVREVFHVPKIGSIAGCYVTDGKIERGQLVRLIRDGIVCYTGKVNSLRRFKDDIKEVQSGYECGVGLENFNDIKLGDTLECYYLEEIKPILS